MFQNLAQPNHAFADWAAGVPLHYTTVLGIGGSTLTQLNRTDPKDHPQRRVMVAGQTVGPQADSYIYEGPSSYRLNLTAASLVDSVMLSRTVPFPGKKLKMYGISIAMRAAVEGTLIRLRVLLRNAAPAVVRWLDPELGWVAADAWFVFRLTPMWRRYHMNFEFPIGLIDFNFMISNQETGVANTIDVGNVWIPDPVHQESEAL